MTHTPGPWRIDGHPGREALEIHSGHRRIAKSLYEYGSEDNEADANAALIAAAPDLLEACKLAKQHLDALRLEARIGLWLSEPQQEVFKFVDETLQAAIRKARAHTTNPDAREWSDDDCPGA